jgi:hypothetical protein
MRIIALIYAYSVCFVSLITFMFAFPLGVDGYYKYLNPTITDGGPEMISKPFLLWKEDFLMRISDSYLEGEEGHHKEINILRLPVPNDSTLQEIYQQQKQFQYDSFKHHLLGPVLQQVFLSVISLIIFIFHWRWLKIARSFQKSGTA